jgi:hypothetical protein
MKFYRGVYILLNRTHLGPIKSWRNEYLPFWFDCIIGLSTYFFKNSPSYRLPNWINMPNPKGLPF